MKMMGSKFNKWLNNSPHKTSDNPEKKFFFDEPIITVKKDGPDEWGEVLWCDKAFEFKGKTYCIDFDSDNIEKVFGWYNKAFDYKENLLSVEELLDTKYGKLADHYASTLNMLKRMDNKDYELLYLMLRQDISLEQKNKLLLLNSLYYFALCSPYMALSINEIITRMPEYTTQYVFFLIDEGYLSYEYKFGAISKKEIEQILSLAGIFVPDGLKKDALVDKLIEVISYDNDVKKYIYDNHLSALRMTLSSKAKELCAANDGIFCPFKDIFIKKYVLQQSVEKSYNDIICSWFDDYIIGTGNIACLKEYFIYPLATCWRDNRLFICKKLMVQWLYCYVNCYQTKELLISIKKNILAESSLKKRTGLILDRLYDYFMDKEYDEDYRSIEGLAECNWGEAEKTIEELYDRDYAIRLFTLNEFKDICYKLITKKMTFVTLKKKIYEKYFYFMQDALYRWNIMIDLDSYQLVIKEPRQKNNPIRELIKAIQNVK